jgi:SP family facilitated glucose transporter-like MFS transporter 8
VNVGYIIFHELTGINVIMLYSNQMLKQMHSADKKGLTARQGVYIIGVINMLASLMSTRIVKYFGRKTLVVWGHAGIAIVHCAIGVFNNMGENLGVLLLLLAFLIIYQNTSGPVAWLYAAETNIDSALGFCLLVLWGSVFILSIVCPILMTTPDQGGIGPSNMFFLLAILSVFGSLYSKFVLIETRGLTDKEKKLLFTPEQYRR